MSNPTRGEAVVGSIFLRTGNHKHDILKNGHFYFVAGYRSEVVFVGEGSVGYYDVVDLTTGTRYDNWGVHNHFTADGDWEYTG